MSTPSILPPHHPNYGLSHHQNYQSNAGYSRANNPLLNGGSRLGASYNFPTPSSNGTSSNSIGAPDPPRQNAIPTSSRPESKPAAMPASSSVSSNNQNPKKRQRSREPDWHKFYKNGLPKEVIVIDDSPTPEPSVSVLSNGQPGRSVAGESSRHPAKKRRRDDVGSAYDPIYQHGPSHSNNQSPEYKDSASGSTISTDRTTSAIHTTAATSLGSHSSNGYEAAEVQPGQKRKRTATRLQIANEAKRKELEVNGDAYTNYKPPPRPPIKAQDVVVKVVADVSINATF
jgi:dual-specificity kinase